MWSKKVGNGYLQLRTRFRVINAVASRDVLYLEIVLCHNLLSNVMAVSCPGMCVAQLVGSSLWRADSTHVQLWGPRRPPRHSSVLLLEGSSLNKARMDAWVQLRSSDTWCEKTVAGQVSELYGPDHEWVTFPTWFSLGFSQEQSNRPRWCLCDGTAQVK